MKTVYIAHPIGGDVNGNVKRVLAICQAVHDPQTIPVVPYLASLQYLHDGSPADRQLGMEANLECLRRRFVDEVWLYGDHISAGMEIEIRLALQLGIPVLAKTSTTATDLIRLLPSPDSH